MPSIAAARATASRTTPPLPTFSRPTSNCGFTSATSSPPGSSFGSTAGSTSLSEMKLTSMTITPTGSGSSSSVRKRAFTRSFEITRGSARSFWCSWP